jgi:CheY-like chemotaxis protein
VDGNLLFIWLAIRKPQLGGLHVVQRIKESDRGSLKVIAAVTAHTLEEEKTDSGCRL